MSEDFFSQTQSPSSTPPKQVASLTKRTGGAESSRRGPPPPAPPGGAANAAAAVRPTTTANTATSRSTLSRPTGTSRPTSTRPARPAATSRPTASAARPTTASAAATSSTTRPKTSTAGAASVVSVRPRAAPVMSRPVGTYYGSTPASASALGGQQQQQQPADDFDWGSPAPAPAVNTNSWAAPAPAAAFSSSQQQHQSSSSDWYSAGDPVQPQPRQQQQPHNMQPAQSNNAFLQPQQSAFLQGSMDTNAPASNNNAAQIHQFVPQPQTANPSNNNTEEYIDFSNEPPLLEELGIHLENIAAKTKAVILPISRFGGDKLDPKVICQDADLAGPIVLCLLLGAEMVMSGKLQFGYIYGFGLFGCLCMTLILNLMSPQEPISVWTVASILGYALLPVNLLGIVKIVLMNLGNLQTLGRILGLVTVVWSTTASTRLLELGCNMREQRYLVAYPIALLYSAFVLMTIF